MERTLSRRAVLAAGAVAAGGRKAFAQAPAPAPVRPPAFRGEHAPKPLPFDPAKLKGLSETLVRSHWENNYGGAVKALNAVEQRLDALLSEKDLPAYVYGDLKREELVRTGSVVLHEHYFGNLGGDGKPSGTALDLVKQSFGSHERWELEFKRTANALGGGSGWVVLALSLHTGEAHNYWAWDHVHAAVLGAPLLVLDMYEHSYHMDFGAAAARYVDTFVENVQWDEVNRRAEWALKVRRG
jgi:Fe-Mn family superoxide dismutase